MQRSTFCVPSSKIKSKLLTCAINERYYKSQFLYGLILWKYQFLFIIVRYNLGAIYNMVDFTISNVYVILIYLKKKLELGLRL